jgi:hypothetical protein
LPFFWFLIACCRLLFSGLLSCFYGTAINALQPASFSGGKGKGEGLICQFVINCFSDWGKAVKWGNFQKIKVFLSESRKLVRH